MFPLNSKITRSNAFPNSIHLQISNPKAYKVWSIEKGSKVIYCIIWSKILYKYSIYVNIHKSKGLLRLDPLISINLSLKCLWNFLSITLMISPNGIDMYTYRCVITKSAEKSFFYWDVTDFGSVCGKGVCWYCCFLI